MFGLLKSVTDLATDVVKVATAPIEIAVDMTRVVTKPLADVAKEMTQEIKDLADE